MLVKCDQHHRLRSHDHTLTTGPLKLVPYLLKSIYAIALLKKVFTLLKKQLPVPY